MNSQGVYNVIIIGAGPSGVGLSVLFEKMGLDDYIMLERDTVGSSFKQWPSYTRFISPSFTGNSFNAIDLNAITPDSSPGYTLGTEHPSGVQYAKYLKMIVDHYEINLSEHSAVSKIEKQDAIFQVHTNGQTFESKCIVWAGGEFQYPAMGNIEGADLCIHSSKVESVSGEDITIIGGYESGMELAIELLSKGKKVTIVDAKSPWDVRHSDSSISLAPHTIDRLRPHAESENLVLIGNTKVTRITKDSEGYIIHSINGNEIFTLSRPILASGFSSLPDIVSNQFALTEKNTVSLTENDESTIVPGMFLVGPKVQHNEAIFCFIYKFRQRFPIVAEAIVEKLGLSVQVPEEYKRDGMYLKDLSCCGDECIC